MSHIHFESMKLYDEDAMEMEEPWNQWEKQFRTSVWMRCTVEPVWSVTWKYRRRAKTVTIGEFDVPEPYRGEMEDGTVYFAPELQQNHWVTRVWRVGVQHHFDRRADGMVHLTQEAAELHGRALASFTEAG